MTLSRGRVALVSALLHGVVYVIWLRAMAGPSAPSVRLWAAAYVGLLTWSATMGLVYGGKRARAWALWCVPLPVFIAFYGVPAVANAPGRSLALSLAAVLGVGVVGVRLGCRLNAAMRSWRLRALDRRQAAVFDADRSTSDDGKLGAGR